MRKILSLVLVATMLFAAIGMTACQPKKTIYETVSEAITKTTALTSYDIKLTLNSSMVEDGETVNQDVVLDYKLVDKNSETSDFSAKIFTEAEGMSIEMGYVFKDKTYYVDALGFKIKTSEGDEGYEDVDMGLEPNEFIDNIIVQIPEELLKDAKVTEQDGNKTVSVDIPDDKFADVFKSWAEDMTSDSEITSTAKNIKVDITVSKTGYIAEYKITLDIDETYEGETATMSASYSIKFNNPGTPVTVELPENADSYKSADEMSNLFG